MSPPDARDPESSDAVPGLANARTMTTTTPAPTPAPPGDATPAGHKLSIVIPVYNEAGTVEKIVGMVVDAPVPAGVTKQIICVNDCSKDGSAAQLDRLPGLFPAVEF